MTDERIFLFKDREGKMVVLHTAYITNCSKWATKTYGDALAISLVGVFPDGALCPLDLTEVDVIEV